jgi:hypothetical protein
MRNEPLVRLKHIKKKKGGYLDMKKSRIMKNKWFLLPFDRKIAKNSVYSMRVLIKI